MRYTMKRIAPILMVLLLLSSTAWCDISFVSTWLPTTLQTSGASVNTGLYGSAAVNDLYVMTWTYTATASPSTGFNGWLPLGQSQNTSSNTITQVWYRPVTSGDVGVTYNFAWNTTAGPIGGIMAFRGTNLTSPIDAFSFHNNGLGTTVTADSITPAGGDALIWIAGGAPQPNYAFGVPFGYSQTMRYGKQSNNWATTAAIKLGAPAQPTGPVNGSSQFSSDLWETALISLTAGAAPPPTPSPVPTGFPPTPGPTATQGPPATTSVPAPTPSAVFTTQAGVPYLVESPDPAMRGTNVSLTWGNMPAFHQTLDFIGLYPAAGPDSNYYAFRYSPGITGSNWPFALGPNLPAGAYNFRYFCCGSTASGNKYATSNTFQIITGATATATATGAPLATATPTPRPTATQPVNTKTATGTPTRTATPFVAPSPTAVVTPGPSAGMCQLGWDTTWGPSSYRCNNFQYVHATPYNSTTSADHRPCTLFTLYTAPAINTPLSGATQEFNLVSTWHVYSNYIITNYPNQAVTLTCSYTTTPGNELNISVRVNNNRNQCQTNTACQQRPYVAQAQVNLLYMNDNHDDATLMRTEFTNKSSMKGTEGPQIYIMRYNGYTPPGTSVRAPDIRLLVGANNYLSTGRNRWGFQASDYYFNPTLANSDNPGSAPGDVIILNTYAARTSREQFDRQLLPSFEATSGGCTVANPATCTPSNCDTYAVSCGGAQKIPLNDHIAMGGQQSWNTIISPQLPNQTIGSAPFLGNVIFYLRKKFPKTPFPAWYVHGPMSKMDMALRAASSTCCIPQINPNNPHFWNTGHPDHCLGSGWGGGWYDCNDDLRNPASAAHFRLDLLTHVTDLVTKATTAGMTGGIVWDPNGWEFNFLMDYVGFYGGTALNSVASELDSTADGGIHMATELTRVTGGLSLMKEAYNALNTGLISGALINTDTYQYDAAHHWVTRIVAPDPGNDCTADPTAYNNLAAKISAAKNTYGMHMFYIDAIMPDPWAATCLLQKLRLNFGTEMVMEEFKSVASFAYQAPYEDAMHYVYNLGGPAPDTAYPWSQVFPNEALPDQQAQWVYPGYNGANAFVFIGTALYWDKLNMNDSHNQYFQTMVKRVIAGDALVWNAGAADQGSNLNADITAHQIYACATAYTGNPIYKLGSGPSDVCPP